MRRWLFALLALSGCGRTYIDRETSQCFPNCLPPTILLEATNTMFVRRLVATDDGSLTLVAPLTATADGTPAAITVDGSPYAAPGASPSVVFVTRSSAPVTNAWVYGAPNTVFEIHDIASDGTQTYTCGDLLGSINAQGTTLNGGTGIEQPVVMVHTSTGELVTTYSLKAPAGNGQCGGIDVRNNILMMSGLLSGQLTIGTDTLSAQTDPNAFDAAFSATNLAPIWHHGLLAPANIYGHGAQVSSDGGAFTSGQFNAAVNFSPPALAYSGGVDVYLFRYDAHGTLLWSHTIAGSGNEDVAALRSSSDAVYICGSTDSTSIAIADKTLTASGSDLYLARFSYAGTVDWSRTGAIANNGRCSAVVIGSDGTVYVGGTFGGSADFGGGPQSRDGVGGFVASFDPTGTLLGVVTFDAGSSVDAMALASDGQLWVAGAFTGHITLNGGHYVSAAAASLFLAPVAVP